MCYALGGFSESERFQVEVRMERDPHLRRETLRRLETAAESSCAELDVTEGPSPAVRDRVLRSAHALGGIEDFMKQFVTSPDECLVVTDVQSRITWANPAFSKMCGYSLSELRGQRPGQLLHGSLTDLKALKRLRKAVRSMKIKTEELINYHKDGHPYWVRLTISPIVDTDGQGRGFVSIERELVSKPIPQRR